MVGSRWHDYVSDVLSDGKRVVISFERHNLVLMAATADALERIATALEEKKRNE